MDRPRRFPSGSFLAFLQFEGSRVAQQQLAHLVGVLQSGEKVQCLRLGVADAASGTLLLYQQPARPQAVDQALPVAEKFGWFLERGDPAVGPAEDVEEVTV